MNWKHLSLIFLISASALGNVSYDDLEPSATNTWDFGTLTLQWKDAFGDGTLDWDTITDGTFTTTAGVVEGTTFNNLVFRDLDLGNICIGDYAGNLTQTGDYNIYIGERAGQDTTTGNRNTFVGTVAGESVTTGAYNVGLGYYALGGSLTTGNYNTVIGTLAGSNSNGSNNVFIGYYTGVFETGSNTLLIDDRLRANEATGRARALLYGIFADAAADQMLRINGDFTVHGDDVWFQPLTDSTHLFQIFDADAGAPIFAVDSTNERIGIGTVAPTHKLSTYGIIASHVGTLGETHERFRLSRVVTPAIRFHSIYGTNSATAANNNITFKVHDAVTETSQTDVLVLRGDNTVGMGTSTPNAHLQNVGDTHLGADNTDYTEFSELGSMTMHGDARVARHLVIGAVSWKIGAGAPTASFEDIYPTLLFADGRDDAAHYGTHIPYRWDDTTDMAVEVHWRHDTVAKTGKVLWNLNYISKKEGEDPAGAGTLISELSAGNHPQDEILVTTFGTDMLAANLERMDNLGLKVWRNGDDGTDLLTENAELIAVHIHYTMNQLGDPFETFYLLLETGDFLLLETGDKLILEGV